jgi:DNA-binding response OmpR family regulator
MKKRVLIVEDDQDILKLLEHYIANENYQPLTAGDGSTGLKLARSQQPHLIILDLMLPGMNGLEVCKELRKHPQTGNIPILILTARGEETDKIIGLELGADDYVTKPFSPRELMARVKALLRRYEHQKISPKSYKYGQLSLDAEKHEVHYLNRQIELATKEFGLLEALLRHIGRVQTRDALLDSVWGDDYYGGSRTVDVHIRKLREKIPQLAEDIVTVKNLGYKLRVK